VFITDNRILYLFRLRNHRLQTLVGAVSDLASTERPYAYVGTSETAPAKNSEGDFPTWTSIQPAPKGVQ